MSELLLKGFFTLVERCHPTSLIRFSRTEGLLGGFTSEMLRSMAVPILMSH
jgi:hypothetical protein